MTLIKQEASPMNDVQSLTHDLVPSPPAHQLPIPDNTVKTLFYWAMDLDITQGARMLLLTVIKHVTWSDGTGCTASIPTLAREAHQTQKTTIGHIKVLIDAGLISRKRRMSKASVTDIATTQLASELPCPVSVETTLTSQCSGYAANQYSSSTNPGNNQSKPKLSESKQPETEKKKKPQEEEKTETTKDRPALGHADGVDAWLETNMPASPMASFAEAMLKHYKKHWWKPYVSDGWHTRTKVAKAAAVYTVDLNTWNKLRVDLRDKMLVGGLPPTASDGTVHTEVLCESCHNMTAAYRPETLLQPREGPPFVDRCDVCLTPELVGVA